MPQGIFIRHIIIFLLTILMVGCAGTPVERALPASKTAQGVLIGATAGAVVGAVSGEVTLPVAAAVGGMLGAVIGNFIEKRATFASALASAGVNVVMVGEDVKLILPTDTFFVGGSERINNRRYGLLEEIVFFTRKVVKVEIKIAGFTDNEGSCKDNLGLSRMRAEALLNYLWHANMDARLVYAIGYGCQFPIATNETLYGRAKNRRIEITMRRIPFAPG